MFLAVNENRHPVTVALDLAVKNCLLTPARESELMGEMRDIVTESAKKFVGFAQAESIRKALDITLGVLSLPLAHSTKGDFQPEEWAHYLLKRGLKTLVGEAIKLIRPIAETSNEAIFEHFVPTDDAIRKYLISYATSRDEKCGNAWSGYTDYQCGVRRREEAAVEKQLAVWLIENLANRHVESWVKSESRDYVLTVSVAETINTLLFRHCTGLPVKGRAELTREIFRYVRFAYEKESKKWLVDAKHRFNELLPRIPSECRKILKNWLGKKRRTWFKVFLGEGPPKVPAKWNDASLRGISGIFLYKMFEE